MRGNKQNSILRNTLIKDEERRKKNKVHGEMKIRKDDKKDKSSVVEKRKSI